MILFYFLFLSFANEIIAESSASQLGKATSAFGTKFTKFLLDDAIKNPAYNVAYSPMVTLTSFMVLLAGAHGRSEDELFNGLALGPGNITGNYEMQNLQKAFKDIRELLTTLEADKSDGGTFSYGARVYRSVYNETRAKFEAVLSDLLADFKSVDFSRPQDVHSEVEAFVRTAIKEPGVSNFDKGDPAQDTTLVAVDALALSASFADDYKFATKNNRLMKFHTNGDRKSQCRTQFMRGRFTLPFGEDRRSGVKLIKLNLKRGLDIYLAVSTRLGRSALRDAFYNDPDKAISELKPTTVDVSIPLVDEFLPAKNIREFVIQNHMERISSDSANFTSMFKSGKTTKFSDMKFDVLLKLNNEGVSGHVGAITTMVPIVRTSTRTPDEDNDHDGQDVDSRGTKQPQQHQEQEAFEPVSVATDQVGQLKKVPKFTADRPFTFVVEAKGNVKLLTGTVYSTKCN